MVPMLGLAYDTSQHFGGDATEVCLLACFCRSGLPPALGALASTLLETSSLQWTSLQISCSLRP